MAEETSDDVPEREWLLANRRGTFAMGSASRRPWRKYHGLLNVRDVGHDQPLHVAVDVGERVELADGSVHRLGPGPDARVAPTAFEADPTPRWRYELGPLTLIREITLDAERDVVRIHWRAEGELGGARLFARPLLTCRPLHRLTQANAALDGRAEIAPDVVRLRPYRELPPVSLWTGGAGRYLESGRWLHGIDYATESARGYPDREDAYVPGLFVFALDGATPMTLAIGVPDAGPAEGPAAPPAKRTARERLAQAARVYPIERPEGPLVVIAGYPWFDAWGRDSLIALSGLTIATGDLEAAGRILDGLAGSLTDGLVPNMLPRTGAGADPHSIDASLWFVRAVGQLADVLGVDEAAARWGPTVLALLARLARPTSIGTHVDRSGLLFADGGPRPLTWMDAIVAGRPVTPRAPYAVEIQGLYHHALCLGARLADARGSQTDRARLRGDAARLAETFRERFWLEDAGYLADAHDGGRPDPALRPNQLIAAGLPDGLVPAELAARLLIPVREQLLTPVGPRTLAPGHPSYRGRCVGSVVQRDLAYHQGTVWPWLLGPYGDTVERAETDADVARAEVVSRLDAIAAELDAGCIGQLGEIHDGDAPHARRGAPAQAWSVAEVLRLAWRWGWDG